MEDNLRAKIKADKLTDNEIKALKAGQDKARVEEIYGRFAKMDDYKRKMQLVNNGFNPYSPMREKTGTVKTNASGEIVYNPIGGKVDAERKLILVRGNVPGPKKGYVVIKTAVKAGK